MSDVEVDPFDFINGDSDGEMNACDVDSDPASVESFEEVIDENVEIEAAEEVAVVEAAVEVAVEVVTEQEPGDDLPELATVVSTNESLSQAIKGLVSKPLILTPTGTPTFADMARSRPASECVVDEPAIVESVEELEIEEIIVEDPEVEDVVVEDVLVEDVIEEVESSAPSIPAPVVQAPVVVTPKVELAEPVPAVTAAETEAEEQAGKQSRAERKTKKAMQKLGLAQVQGINRVVLRKDKSLLFVVPNPEVFKRGDTWVVLGEARVEDPNQRAREMAAQKMAENVQQKEKPEKIPQTITEEDEDEEEVSTEGIEEKDIELVMQQAGCSKPKAISALKNNANDIVNAIMELTV